MLLEKLENCKIDVRRCKIEYMLLDRERESVRIVRLVLPKFGHTTATRVGY